MLRHSMTAFFAIAFVLCTLAAAHANVRDVAPADEYFGPFKESILGIRNHLVALEAKSNGDLVLASAVTGIDNVEIAIEDWHTHYPRDPWLPRFLDRVVHVYARAHAMTDRYARRALSLLERDYAGSPQARDAAAVAETP